MIYGLYIINKAGGLIFHKVCIHSKWCALCLLTISVHALRISPSCRRNEEMTTCALPPRFTACMQWLVLALRHHSPAQSQRHGRSLPELRLSRQVRAHKEDICVGTYDTIFCNLAATFKLQCKTTITGEWNDLMLSLHVTEGLCCGTKV